MSQLVFRAFQAIGPPGPQYRREVALVAKAIRESGDDEALALFGVGAEPDPDPAFDHEARRRVTEAAEHAGADGLTALDLYTAVVNPNWAPFGDSPYYEGAA